MEVVLLSCVGEKMLLESENERREETLFILFNNSLVTKIALALALAWSLADGSWQIPDLDS
jgi:hypothetical protein